MDIKKATSFRLLSIHGIVLFVGLFVGQACWGMNDKNTSPQNVIQQNSAKKSYFFDFFQKPFNSVTQNIQNLFLYKTTVFIGASLLGTVCSVARRYRVPVIAGSAAGALTYAGCSYFGIRQKGFLAGAAFAGVTAAVAWFCYQAEIKKDLAEIKERVKNIQSKLEMLANETAEKVLTKVIPLLGQILDKIDAVPAAVQKSLKFELEKIEKLINEAKEENKKEHKITQDKIDKFSELQKTIEQLTTTINDLKNKILNSQTK